MKKRILKDLPFRDVKKGDVIGFINNRYRIDHGDMIYDGGSTAHIGITEFDLTEHAILDKIWNDSEWFEEAKINHVNVVASKDHLTLWFDSLDLADAQEFARGVIHLMRNYFEKSSENRVEKKFRGFLIQLKNK